MNETNSGNLPGKLEFYGGRWMVFVPFILALIGLIYIASRNANIPEYWVIFLLPIVLGILLAKNREAYSQAVIRGLMDPLVAIMVMALTLAGVAGSLLSQSGVIGTLAVYTAEAHLTGSLFTFVTFLLTCLVAFATGTSVGTILTVGPILYPVGCLLGANPAFLIGAIVSGGAFGDNLAPVSDTTIASATTQEMDIGGVVRSRLKYSLPAAGISALLYLLIPEKGTLSLIGGIEKFTQKAEPLSLLMLLVPIVIVVLCLMRRHLVTALSCGVITGLVVGLITGIFKPSDIVSVPQQFGAGGVVLDGINNAIPTVLFVLMIFPLINILREGGGLEIILNGLSKIVKTPRGAETAIVFSEIVLNAATGVNTVAIVATGELANKLGKRYNIHGYRRANLLDCAGATFNYILPYMVPVLMGTMLSTANKPFPEALPVAPIQISISEFYPWVMLIILIISILTGYGRTFMSDSASQVTPKIETN